MGARLESKGIKTHVLDKGKDENAVGARGASPLHRVADGTRTRDSRDHNPGLYQLSYGHRAVHTLDGRSVIRATSGASETKQSVAIARRAYPGRYGQGRA